MSQFMLCHKLYAIRKYIFRWIDCFFFTVTDQHVSSEHQIQHWTVHRLWHDKLWRKMICYVSYNSCSITSDFHGD